jgi:hypothetical protein
MHTVDLWNAVEAGARTVQDIPAHLPANSSLVNWIEIAGISDGDHPGSEICQLFH